MNTPSPGYHPQANTYDGEGSQGPGPLTQPPLGTGAQGEGVPTLQVKP